MTNVGIQIKRGLQAVKVGNKEKKDKSVVLRKKQHSNDKVGRAKVSYFGGGSKAMLTIKNDNRVSIKINGELWSLSAKDLATSLINTKGPSIPITCDNKVEKVGRFQVEQRLGLSTTTIAEMFPQWLKEASVKVTKKAAKKTKTFKSKTAPWGDSVANDNARKERTVKAMHVTDPATWRQGVVFPDEKDECFEPELYAGRVTAVERGDLKEHETHSCSISLAMQRFITAVMFVLVLPTVEACTLGVMGDYSLVTASCFGEVMSASGNVSFNGMNCEASFLGEMASNEWLAAQVPLVTPNADWEIIGDYSYTMDHAGGCPRVGYEHNVALVTMGTNTVHYCAAGLMALESLDCRNDLVSEDEWCYTTYDQPLYYDGRGLSTYPDPKVRLLEQLAGSSFVEAISADTVIGTIVYDINVTNYVAEVAGVVTCTWGEQIVDGGLGLMAIITICIAVASLLACVGNLVASRKLTDFTTPVSATLTLPGMAIVVLIAMVVGTTHVDAFYSCDKAGGVSFSSWDLTWGADVEGLSEQRIVANYVSTSKTKVCFAQDELSNQGSVSQLELNARFDRAQLRQEAIPYGMVYLNATEEGMGIRFHWSQTCGQNDDNEVELRSWMDEQEAQGRLTRRLHTKKPRDRKCPDNKHHWYVALSIKNNYRTVYRVEESENLVMKYTIDTHDIVSGERNSGSTQLSSQLFDTPVLVGDQEFRVTVTPNIPNLGLSSLMIDSDDGQRFLVYPPTFNQIPLTSFSDVITNTGVGGWLMMPYDMHNSESLALNTFKALDHAGAMVYSHDTIELTYPKPYHSSILNDDDYRVGKIIPGSSIKRKDLVATVSSDRFLFEVRVEGAVALMSATVDAAVVTDLSCAASQIEGSATVSVSCTVQCLTAGVFDMSVDDMAIQSSTCSIGTNDIEFTAPVLASGMNALALQAVMICDQGTVQRVGKKQYCLCDDGWGGVYCDRRIGGGIIGMINGIQIPTTCLFDYMLPVDTTIVLYDVPKELTCTSSDLAVTSESLIPTAVQVNDMPGCSMIFGPGVHSIMVPLDLGIVGSTGVFMTPGVWYLAPETPGVSVDIVMATLCKWKQGTPNWTPTLQCSSSDCASHVVKYSTSVDMVVSVPRVTDDYMTGGTLNLTDYVGTLTVVSTGLYMIGNETFAGSNSFKFTDGFVLTATQPLFYRLLDGFGFVPISADGNVVCDGRSVNLTSATECRVVETLQGQGVRFKSQIIETDGNIEASTGWMEEGTTTLSFPTKVYPWSPAPLPTGNFGRRLLSTSHLCATQRDGMQVCDDFEVRQVKASRDYGALTNTEEKSYSYITSQTWFEWVVLGFWALMLACAVTISYKVCMSCRSGYRPLQQEQVVQMVPPRRRIGRSIATLDVNQAAAVVVLGLLHMLVNKYTSWNIALVIIEETMKSFAPFLGVVMFVVEITKRNNIAQVALSSGHMWWHSMGLLPAIIAHVASNKVAVMVSKADMALVVDIGQVFVEESYKASMPGRAAMLALAELASGNIGAVAVHMCALLIDDVFARVACHVMINMLTEQSGLIGKAKKNRSGKQEHRQAADWRKSNGKFPVARRVKVKNNQANIDRDDVCKCKLYCLHTMSGKPRWINGVKQVTALHGNCMCSRECKHCPNNTSKHRENKHQGKPPTRGNTGGGGGDSSSDSSLASGGSGVSVALSVAAAMLPIVPNPPLLHWLEMSEHREFEDHFGYQFSSVVTKPVAHPMLLNIHWITPLMSRKKVVWIPDIGSTHGDVFNMSYRTIVATSRLGMRTTCFQVRTGTRIDTYNKDLIETEALMRFKGLVAIEVGKCEHLLPVKHWLGFVDYFSKVAFVTYGESTFGPVLEPIGAPDGLAERLASIMIGVDIQSSSLRQLRRNARRMVLATDIDSRTIGQTTKLLVKDALRIINSHSSYYNYMVVGAIASANESQVVWSCPEQVYMLPGARYALSATMIVCHPILWAWSVANAVDTYYARINRASAVRGAVVAVGAFAVMTDNFKATFGGPLHDNRVRALIVAFMSLVASCSRACVVDATTLSVLMLAVVTEEVAKSVTYVAVPVIVAFEFNKSRSIAYLPAGLFHVATYHMPFWIRLTTHVVVDLSIDYARYHTTQLGKQYSSNSLGDGPKITSKGCVEVSLDGNYEKAKSWLMVPVNMTKTVVNMGIGLEQKFDAEYDEENMYGVYSDVGLKLNNMLPEFNTRFDAYSDAFNIDLKATTTTGFGASTGLDLSGNKTVGINAYQNAGISIRNPGRADNFMSLNTEDTRKLYFGKYKVGFEKYNAFAADAYGPDLDRFNNTTFSIASSAYVTTKKAAISTYAVAKYPIATSWKLLRGGCQWVSKKAILIDEKFTAEDRVLVHKADDKIVEIVAKSEEELRHSSRYRDNDMGDGKFIAEDWVCKTHLGKGYSCCELGDGPFKAPNGPIYKTHIKNRPMATWRMRNMGPMDELCRTVEELKSTFGYKPRPSAQAHFQPGCMEYEAMDICVQEEWDDEHKTDWRSNLPPMHHTSKEVIHDWFCEPRRAFYARAFSVEGVEVSIFRGCTCNTLAALRSRVTSMVPFQAEWHEWFKLARKLDPIEDGSYRKWLRHLPGSARQRAIQADEQGLDYPEVFRRYGLKAFIKRETRVHKVGWHRVKKMAIPRLIQGESDEIQANVNKWFYYYSAALKEAYKPDGDYVFASGLSAEQIGEWYDAQIALGRTIHAYDTTRWDGHVTGDMLDELANVYKACGAPESLLKLAFRRHGKQQGFAQNCIEYEADDQMKSGQGDTTPGNSGPHLVIGESCPDIDAMMVQGDDALVATEFTKRVIAYYARANFTANEPKMLDFCSMLPWPTLGGGTVFGPKIGRIIGKTFHSKNAGGIKKQKEWLRGVCLGLWRSCNHIPVLRILIPLILIQVGKGKVKFEDKHEYKSRASGCHHVCENTWNYIHKRYDLTESEVRKLEDQIIDSFTIGCRITHPAIITFVNVDCGSSRCLDLSADDIPV